MGRRNVYRQLLYFLLCDHGPPGVDTSEAGVHVMCCLLLCALWMGMGSTYLPGQATELVIAVRRRYNTAKVRRQYRQGRNADDAAGRAWQRVFVDQQQIAFFAGRHRHRHPTQRARRLGTIGTGVTRRPCSPSSRYALQPG